VWWVKVDLQAAMYTHAARQIISPDVRGCIFRFIKKKKPLQWDQLILKSGKLTERKDVPKITTGREYRTALWVKSAMDILRCDKYDGYNAVLAVWRDDTSELGVASDFAGRVKNLFRAAEGAYYNLLTLLDMSKAFFWDVRVGFSAEQLDTVVDHILYPTMLDMYDMDTPYPTGLGCAWAQCERCDFNQPCLLAQRGVYPSELLEVSYRTREDIEDEARNA